MSTASVFATALLWEVTMGGHDDEDMSYAVNKQKQDEELKNKLNESSHWCDQDTTGNNAKWLKEGQNQLRKVTENQQDQDHNCNISQNGNKEDFPHQTNTQDEQQGKEEQTKSPKNAMTPGLSQEESKNVLNEPLLIDTLESTEEKDKEAEEDGKEKECDGSEDSAGVAEQQSNAEPQKEGGVLGRNACLLFSNLNGSPIEEESSWPSLSQDNTADSSPNDNRGNHKCKHAIVGCMGQWDRLLRVCRQRRYMDKNYSKTIKWNYNTIFYP